MVIEDFLQFGKDLMRLLFAKVSRSNTNERVEVKLLEFVNKS